jgi:hypothetical protein
MQQDEKPPAPPAFPQRATLLEFEIPGQRDFRNYVDGATLSVDAKGVVRYVFVSRSPSGVENVSYEGLRCTTGEYRVYALGRPDRTWGGRLGGWRPIKESPLPHQRILYREYFCPQGNAIASVDEGRRALQDGGHPWTKSFSGDALRGLGR